MSTARLGENPAPAATPLTAAMIGCARRRIPGASGGMLERRVDEGQGHQGLRQRLAALTGQPVWRERRVVFREAITDLLEPRDIPAAAGVTGKETTPVTAHATPGECPGPLSAQIRSPQAKNPQVSAASPPRIQDRGRDRPGLLEGFLAKPGLDLTPLQ